MKRMLTMCVMILFAVEAKAVDMVEAINAALANHESIARQEAVLSGGDALVREAASAFLPTVEASYAVESTSRNEASAAFPEEDTDASAASVTVSLELFAGFSNVSALAGARSERESRNYALKGTVADVVRDTRIAYVGVLRARRTLDVERKTLALMERQLADTRLFFEQGILSRVDVLKVEVERARAERRVLGAENAYANAVVGLERMMGRQLRTDESIADVGSSGHQAIGDVDRLTRLAVERSSEIHALASARDALVHGEHAARGAYLPRISVSGTHREYGEGASVNGRDDLHDAEDAVAVAATWQIFAGGANRARHVAARSERMAALHRLSGAKRDIRVAVSRAASAYELARNTLAVAEVEVERANEHLRVTRLLYAQHMATATDLLDAAHAAAQAENGLHSARYDIEDALTELERLVEEPLSFK